MAKRGVVAEPGLFTRADYEVLMRERRRLNDLIAVLDKAQACGVECSAFREMRNKIDEQLSMIQAHFMNPIPG